MTEDNHAIAAAKIQRDEICEKCFKLLYQISRKSSCLKLLNLAQTHLQMLADYKSRRR